MNAPKPKHTPGPWTAVDVDDKREHPAIMGRGHCVATVWHNDLTRKACEANAHLIEDAPAIALALRMIQAGVARIESRTGEFCFNGLRVSIGRDWTGVICALRWDKCQAALDAALEAA